MSYHYLPNSIYENRSNLSEAKYIAQMVKKLLSDNIKETIGIVAFSQEQQSVIEEAIDELAVSDTIFDELLEKAYNRKDDGQFTGLFVKNLENVQGDERDIIIMSVCYGHDSNKKMLMNFGPINRKGGEKRLNVIFSRARKHMAVVSSIRHFHITNDYNDGASYFKRFLQYAEMVSVGNMNMAKTILDGLLTDDKKKKTNMVESSVTIKQIKKSIEQSGYKVDEYIGQSTFKCNLGVKKNSEDNYYTLGILVDDNFHYSNNDLVEQYYQRPAILNAFGWQVVSVFAKDWLEDSERVLSSLLKLIEDPIYRSVSEPILKTSAITSTLEDLIFERLVSADKEKFWEIAQKLNQLYIRFGKKGTNGQLQVKTYGSEIEAEFNKSQLITEQGIQGYVKHYGS